MHNLSINSDTKSFQFSDTFDVLNDQFKFLGGSNNMPMNTQMNTSTNTSINIPTIVIFILICSLYVAVKTNNVPEEHLYLIEHSLSKVLIMGLIIFISKDNPIISIIALVIYCSTLQSLQDNIRLLDIEQENDINNDSDKLSNTEINNNYSMSAENNGIDIEDTYLDTNSENELDDDSNDVRNYLDKVADNSVDDVSPNLINDNSKIVGNSVNDDSNIAGYSVNDDSNIAGYSLEDMYDSSNLGNTGNNILNNMNNMVNTGIEQVKPNLEPFNPQNNTQNNTQNNDEINFFDPKEESYTLIN